jgi:glycosyltransferase involved in cell wall biosynthesis
MSAVPRVVFGMAAYNRPATIGRTLESLLSQTLSDIAVVIVDDHPTPEVLAAVEATAAGDPRVVYVPNPSRLGMIANWQRAFECAREKFPASPFFAWASDHDAWHPRWAELLSEALTRRPDCALAYPQLMRMYSFGRRRITTVADTARAGSARERLRLSTTTMTAGNCVYGLFRTRALDRVGGFPAVLLPDRLLLLELAVFSRVIQVPEILWYREVAGAFSYKRQRRMLFAGRVPLFTYLPPTLQHFGVLFRSLALQGRGRPEVGRVTGAGLALSQLWWSTRRQMLHNDALWRQWLRAIVSTKIKKWVLRRFPVVYGRRSSET